MTNRDLYSSAHRVDVSTVIARVLEIDPARVTDELAYQSIAEWDSMQHMVLMASISEAFGVEIDGAMVPELSTVAAIRAFVQGRRTSAEESGVHALPPSTRTPDAGVCRGLAGVTFDRTLVSEIDGAAGGLSFRGYSVHELAENATFEETVHLLLFGELPTSPELQALRADLAAAWTLPRPVADLVAALADAHPMDVLRTAVSALGAVDPDRHDTSLDATLRKGTRLIAQVGAIVAAHHAAREGRAPRPFDPSLSFAENVLAMLSERPTPHAARLLDTDLVIHAEHGSNASTFVARTVTGTRADVHAAVTAALAAFSGPLHGGAAEGVMRMLEEIGEPERAYAYVEERLARHEPVMGFGHRVYRVEDPRARHLKRAALELSRVHDEPKWLEILDALADAMRRFAQYGLHINVDFYTGVAYRLMGIPSSMFVPLFALSRIAGIVAHVHEQQANNILIRPLLAYAGERGRRWASLDERDAAARTLPPRRDSSVREIRRLLDEAV
jgi:citrate synthase